LKRSSLTTLNHYNNLANMRVFLLSETHCDILEYWNE